MAILKVSMMGHPVLRAKAKPIPPQSITSPAVQQLIEDMFETMHEYQGIGLAAPQVHVGLRLFVAGTREAEVTDLITDDHEMPFIALINPEIATVGHETIDGWEGCLSIPEIRGRVPRAHEILVKAYDHRGKRVEFRASGLPARVIQHEADHLDGVLFFDRMKSFESLTYMEEYRRYWAKREDDEDDDATGGEGQPAAAATAKAPGATKGRA